MPALHLILREPAWPELADRADVIHLTEPISIVGLTGGMESGKASVAIRFDLPDGTPVIAETSLALLVIAARGLQAKFGMVGDPGPDPEDAGPISDHLARRLGLPPDEANPRT